MCLHVCQLQLEAARTGNNEGSKKLHDKIAEAQTSIEVRIPCRE